MAGDWIKVEDTTPDKPEVSRMAEALGVTPEHILGCMVRVWIWADQQSIDGNAVGVSDLALDGIARNAGIASAMRKEGWIVGDGATLSFPNFERHNGETAKKRALTNRRVKRFRNDSNVTSSLPEKRREENIKPPIVPLPDFVPRETWEAFCGMRKGLKGGRFGDRAQKGILTELGKLKAAGHDPRAVLEQSVRNEWKDVYPIKAGAAGGKSASADPFKGAI